MADLLLVLPLLVLGSPGYPPVIQNHLALNWGQPPCTICHTTPTGGVGTATQNFALNMKAHGLVALNNSSLTNALDGEQADMTASNQMGVPDVTALKNGDDPNTGLSLIGPNPVYGCGARIGGEDRPDGLVTSLLLAGSGALLARALFRQRREPGQ